MFSFNLQSIRHTIYISVNPLLGERGGWEFVWRDLLNPHSAVNLNTRGLESGMNEMC